MVEPAVSNEAAVGNSIDAGWAGVRKAPRGEIRAKFGENRAK